MSRIFKALVQLIMKKISTLTILALVIFSTHSFSQIKTGFSAGVTHSRWSGDAMGSLNNLLDFSNGYITTEPVNGLYAGGFVEIPLAERISVQPGLYYSQKGYRLQGEVSGKNIDFLSAGARATVRSHYIELPLVIKAEVAKGLQIYAGPQVSYLVKNNLRMDAGVLGVSLFKTNVDITNQFNRTDLSLTGGLAYTFDNGFSVNAGYDHGLSRLDKNTMTQSYNRSFKVGIGFTF